MLEKHKDGWVENQTGESKSNGESIRKARKIENHKWKERHKEKTEEQTYRFIAVVQLSSSSSSHNGII